jgi:hypothetical protein
MKTKLTIKQREILEFISRNGKTQVEVNPRLVNQNKNYYDRVVKLENLGAIIIERRQGYSSLYSITNVGLEYLGLGTPSKKIYGAAGQITDLQKISSPIERMRMDVLVSDLDKTTKDELLRVLG